MAATDGTGREAPTRRRVMRAAAEGGGYRKRRGRNGSRDIGLEREAWRTARFTRPFSSI